MSKVWVRSWVCGFGRHLLSLCWDTAVAEIWAPRSHCGEGGNRHKLENSKFSMFSELWPTLTHLLASQNVLSGDVGKIRRAGSHQLFGMRLHQKNGTIDIDAWRH
jgi:hypothetical protein